MTTIFSRDERIGDALLLKRLRSGGVVQPREGQALWLASLNSRYGEETHLIFVRRADEVHFLRRLWVEHRPDELP